MTLSLDQIAIHIHRTIFKAFALLIFLVTAADRFLACRTAFAGLGRPVGARDALLGQFAFRGRRFVVLGLVRRLFGALRAVVALTGPSCK